MDDLVQLRSAIWPIFEGAGRRLAFFGIPSGDTLRWILPDDRSAALAAMAGWRPYAWRSRMKFAVLQALIATLGPSATPRLLEVGEMEVAEQAPLAFTGDLSPVFYIGTPGPRRKAVCHMVDGRGTVVAILKLALEPEAWSAIKTEARMLQRLAEELPALCVPRITSLDLARGLSAQTVLEGHPVGRVFGDAHVDYLLAMRRKDAVDLATCSEALVGRIDSVALPGLSQGSLSRWQAAMVGRVASVWQHGDFTPWNLRRTARGIAAYDWEAGHSEGLPLWDVAHFYAIQAHLFRKGVAPLVALSRNNAVARYLAEFGIDATGRDVLFGYYCLGAALDALRNDDPGYALFLVNQFEARWAA